MQNQCLIPNLIYRADVKDKTNEHITKSTLVLRQLHSWSGFETIPKILTISNMTKNTEISKYVWLLKNGNITSRIKGEVWKKYIEKPVFGR